MAEDCVDTAIQVFELRPPPKKAVTDLVLVALGKKIPASSATRQSSIVNERVNGLVGFLSSESSHSVGALQRAYQVPRISRLLM